MNNDHKNRSIYRRSFLAVLNAMLLSSYLLTLPGCDFLEPEISPDQVSNADVFQSDATTVSAINGVYAEFMLGVDPVYLLNGSMSLIGGLSSDELRPFSQSYIEFYNNEINPSGTTAQYYGWQYGYSVLYEVNAILEELPSATGVTDAVKNQVLGEAYFVRAFIQFYLTNLYGAIPIVTSTDYEVNTHLTRSPKADVYVQIEEDLLQAESLVADAYPSSYELRPCKSVVRALLARYYLYNEQMSEAAEYASQVISGSYSLEENLEDVFAISSSETIWHLIPANTNRVYVNEIQWFTPVSGVPTNVLSAQALSAIESGDNRLSEWADTLTYEDTLYYYPEKYGVASSVVDHYSVIMRLSEQYLIRAEAEAEQDELAAALADLNVIRERAGLAPWEEAHAADKESILEGIMKERQIEFFGEWGHRWFDLIRTGQADAVLGSLKPYWETTDQLWPIPTSEISVNTNLTQNDGY